MVYVPGKYASRGSRGGFSHRGGGSRPATGRIKKRAVKKSQRNRGPEFLPPDQVFVMTVQEVLVEMQMKFTGLYNLSMKTGHKLIDQLARTIGERMKEVADSSPGLLDTGFKLSSAYRRAHPHFGDFQLILDTLHNLQEAAGAPKLNLQESDLMVVPAQPFVMDDVPFNKVQAACKKYSSKIAKKIEEHVKSLESKVGPEDSIETIARKKIREKLKKLSPFLPLIVKEVIENHFIPPKGPFHKFRIYGEPFMPNKEVMAPLIKRHRAVSIMRSDRMYNMLRLAVPLAQYHSMMAMDQTVIEGAKLVIRSSELITRQLSPPLIRQLRQMFGATDLDADIALPEEEVPDEKEEQD